MRFRTKTILGVALIEMALLAVLVGSALSILRDSNEEELVRRVQLGGKLLAAAAKDAVISQDLATLDSLVEVAISTGQIDVIRIIDSKGTVLTERGKSILLSHTFHQEENLAQVKDNVFDWAAPISAGGIKYGEVQVGVSIDPLNLLLNSAQRWAAGIAGLEMLLVAIFSWLLGTYLVRQLDALRNASVRIANGDFSHRVLVQGSDEIAQTAIAFNRMAGQIGESHKQLLQENQERQKAQQWAEDRNEQLNGIFTLSPDGFVSFDSSHLVKYASPAFTKLTGLTVYEIIGLDEKEFSKKLVRVSSSQARFPGIDNLRAAVAFKSDDELFIRRQFEIVGTMKRILEVGLLESKSESVSQILYFRDITRDIEVDCMKSEFLSIAAHELRTPMASIYGYTELLQAQDFSESDRREFLHIIYKQSKLMISIINELIDLARIEARRGKDFVMQPVRISDLIEETVVNFLHPDGRENPQLLNPPPPVFVMVDKAKMVQAINNIFSNAYKYSPNGGAVNIDVMLSKPVLNENEESRVEIIFSDEGLGMTEDQLSRVFERFYRADASGNIPGAGLGMSIVKEIVEIHGGQVSITSKYGKGTVVTIWLPILESNVLPN